VTLQTFTLGTFAQQGIAAGDFDSIATTTVGAGGAATVTFSSIPGTYAHLQIRILGRTTASSTAPYLTGIRATFNSDSASNYSWHWLDGSGSAATAGAGTSQAYLYVGNVTDSTATSNTFGASICDILDYKDTNKYKTVRYLFGADGNGAGYVEFGSGNWRSTSAITSITMVPTAGTSFAQYSSFALYGIKG